VPSVGASQRTSVYTDYHLFGRRVKADRSNGQMADAAADLEPSLPARDDAPALADAVQTHRRSPSTDAARSVQTLTTASV